MMTKIGLEEAQMKFSEDVPVEILHAGPDRYAPLDREKQGSWRYVMQAGQPVGVIWTDWEKGFGVHGLVEGPTLERVRGYEVHAKAVDVPAGWAYSSMETFVNRMKDDHVELSVQTEGKLSGVYEAQGEEATSGEDTES